MNPNDPSDAALDSDGDGLTSLQEFIAGTDPKNKASRLELQLVSSTAAGAQLSFASVPGKSYSIQYRNNLLPSNAWQKLMNTNATGTQITVQDTDAATKNTRFYRLVTPAAN